MPPLTPQSSASLDAAGTLAAAYADRLRNQCGRLQAMKAVPEDVLKVREYPDRLGRGLERGRLRLENAARALDFVAESAHRIAAGKPVHHLGPALAIEAPWTARWARNVVSVRPADARAHVRPIPQYVSAARDIRTSLRLVDGHLAEVKGEKPTTALSNALDEARTWIERFEINLTNLDRHVHLVIRAVEKADSDPNRLHLPPMLIRKLKHGKGVGPGGKGGSGGSGVGVKPGRWPGNSAGKQAIACWLAASAQKHGLPPTMLVAASTVESNLGNPIGGDHDSVGMFQIRASIHPVPAGFGQASGKKASASWWQEHPEAQVAWFAAEAKRVKPSGSTPNTADEISNWIANTERPAAEYRGRYRQHYGEAAALVKKCGSGGGSGTAVATPGKGASVSVAAGGLRAAQGQLKAGVHEIGGEDRGPAVSKYLSASGVGTPNPWCAAFVFWCMKQAGFKWPPGNWAYCPNYIAEASKPKGAMYNVGNREARAGDFIVWHGHIGIVESAGNGKITFVAGNHGDQVARDSRSMGDTSFQIIRPRAQ